MPRRLRSRKDIATGYHMEPLDPRLLLSTVTRAITYPQPVIFHPFNDSDSIVTSAVAPDGKIFVLGTTSTGGNGSVAFAARLNANLSPDTTFGTNGTVISTVSGEHLTSLAIAPDNSIYVAGDIGNGNFHLLHLTAAGAMDPGFNSGNAVNVTFPPFNYHVLGGVAIDPNGRIVLAGTINGDVALARVNSDGSLDTSFGFDGVSLDNGQIIFHQGGTQTTSILISTDLAMLVQPSGKIVVCGLQLGGSQNKLITVRFDSFGNVDPTFGNLGEHDDILSSSINPSFINFGNPSLPSVTTGTSIVAQSNGSLIELAGFTEYPGNPANFFTRLTPDGSSDTNFNPSLAGATYTAVATTPSGKILLAGPAALLQLNANGSPDSTFGSNGADSLPVDALPGSAAVVSIDFNQSGTPILAIDHLANAIRSGFVTVTGAPELAVTSLSISDTSASQISVTVQTSARGSLGGHSAALSLVASRDSVFGNSDDVLLMSATPGVGPQSNTYSLADSALPDGSYFLIAAIDPSNTTAESDETNNMLAAPFVLSSTDLSIQITGNDPIAYSDIFDDSGFEIDSETTNVNFTGLMHIRYALSTDTIFGNSDDSMAGGINFDAIGTGGYPFSGQQSVSHLLPHGFYYLLAEVDSGNTARDADLSNNVFIGPLVEVNPPIDYSIASMTYPDTATAGQGSFSVTVTPGGTTGNPFGTSVSYTLSQDNILGNADDILLYNGDFFSNQPTLSFNRTLPDSLPSGTYRIIADIDPGNSATETNKSNNVFVGPAIQISADPDASSTNSPSTGDLSVSDLSVTVGDAQSFMINCTLNDTEFPVTSVPVSFYVSSSATFNSSATRLGSQTVIPTGIATSVSLSFSAAAFAPGSYHVFVVADPADTITESDETNNTAASTNTPVMIPAPGPTANVVLTALSTASTLHTGESLSTSLSLQTTAGLPDFTVAYYLIRDGDSFNPSAAALQTMTFSSSSSSPLSLALTIPQQTVVGTYRIVAVADLSNAIPESNESDNSVTSAAFTLTIPPQADLRSSLSPVVVGTKTPKTTATTITLSNTGDLSTSGTVDVTYVLSTSAHFSDAVYTFPIQHYAAPLTAGGSKSFPASLTLPAVRKTGSYYIVARPHSSDTTAAGDDLSNNDSASTALNLAGPNVILKAVLGAFSKGQQTITLTNKGKDSAKDKVEILLQAAARKSTQGAISFTPFFKTLNLLPGKSITFSVRAVGASVHGSKFLVASVFYPFDSTPASAILFSSKPVKLP